MAKSENDLQTKFSRLESVEGGRLGVGVAGLDGSQILGYRQHERFGMCSTFKLPLAAVILMAVDSGELTLDQKIPFTAADMVPYAPVTKRYLERGYMSVGELAQAAQTTSDNPAANLLLGLIGGPNGFTQRLRRIGDATTRLDRYEPQLNLVPTGEIRDTTTPAAMASTVQTLLTESVLSAASLQLLMLWLRNTRTGANRLRAGFPERWDIGNKTGTGIAKSMANKYNDVGVAWRHEGGAPLIITAYYEADDYYEEIRPKDEAVLRQVAEIVVGAS